MKAMKATRAYVMKPQIIAEKAIREIVLALDGARALSTPIWIPTDPRFAKPQRAYWAMTQERCES